MRVHVMLIAILGLAAVAYSYPAQNVDSNEEYGDYDDRPEGGSKGTPTPSAGAALPAARPTAPRGRPPVALAPRAPPKTPVRGAIPAAAAAAPTTEKAKPVEEPEGDYEDGPAEGAGEEIAADASSTTEAPRKKVGGVVRPFRSNHDLIEALKRRRQQASAGAPLIPLHSTSTTTPKPETTPASKKASNGRALSVSNNNSKRKFGADSAPPASATANVTPRPPPPPRKYGTAPSGSVRPFKSASVPSAAPLTAAETSSSEVTADPNAPSRPRSFSRSRRL